MARKNQLQMSSIGAQIEETKYDIFNCDAFEWLGKREANSIHA